MLWNTHARFASQLDPEILRVTKVISIFYNSNVSVISESDPFAVTFTKTNDSLHLTDYPSSKKKSLFNAVR